MRLDENIGAVGYENIINQNAPGADAFSVSMRAGLGVVLRGTVLSLSAGSTGDSAMVILGTTAIANETLTANCILAQDIDTGSGTGAVVTALAYRSGHFNRNKLTVKAAHTMTAIDEENLRSGGIILSDAFER